MKKGRISLFSVVLAVILIVSATPFVFAQESEIKCESCEEIISQTDVIYGENGEISCVYCEEILSQELLDKLFFENVEMTEEGIICTECENIVSDDEASYNEAGVLICPYCGNGEDSESDNPEDYTDEEEGTSIQLNASQWAQKEAMEAYSKNLVPDEMLGLVLNTDISREQFAAVAVKLYERITSKTADTSTEGLPFSDCDAAGAYTGYVAAAYKLGITNGTSEATFAPQQVITREQLATMLYRVVVKAQSEGIMVKSVVTVPAVFSDEASISDYAKECVYYMARRGIIKGMSETTFAPAGVATKEQAILISNRIASTLY